MGRARSQEELDKVIATVRNTDGVDQVVSYAFVRL
jgi:osmotically-inducible protein OsmY